MKNIFKNANNENPATEIIKEKPLTVGDELPYQEDQELRCPKCGKQLALIPGNNTTFAHEWWICNSCGLEMEIQVHYEATRGTTSGTKYVPKHITIENILA